MKKLTQKLDELQKRYEGLFDSVIDSFRDFPKTQEILKTLKQLGSDIQKLRNQISSEFKKERETEKDKSYIS